MCLQELSEIRRRAEIVVLEAYCYTFTPYVAMFEKVEGLGGGMQLENNEGEIALSMCRVVIGGHLPQHLSTPKGNAAVGNRHRGYSR